MTVTIHPSAAEGSLQVQPSKSSMLRACAAALLRCGITVINNPGNSNDDHIALEVITQLGARISKVNKDSITIESNGVCPVSDKLNCGESALAARMFTPIAALAGLPIKIIGSGTLLTRPMEQLVTILSQLGVQIHSNDGKLPLKIQGQLKPVSLDVDGSISSQYLTGLLMAFAASGQEKLTITVTNLKSSPYIDLTLDVMQRFGFRVQHIDYSRFTTNSPLVTKDKIAYTVEGDWSGAAFILVAGALSGWVKLTGLNVGSCQADKAILQPLFDTGAFIQIHTNHLIVARPVNGLLKPFNFDATDCPDLFPPLVALAAACAGKSRIKGVHRLIHKESDRGLTLQQEFLKMGVIVQFDGDWMIVQGISQLKAAKVHSHHDHRIAMACAVAALRAEGAVEIGESGAVNKSYPSFFNHLSQLGVSLSLNTAPA